MTANGRHPPPLLNWNDSSHWSHRQRPCRYCSKPTNLRDSKRSPAHKTCAEDALRQQVADAAAGYENGRII